VRAIENNLTRPVLLAAAAGLRTILPPTEQTDVAVLRAVLDLAVLALLSLVADYVGHLHGGEH
jgi:hypothetical protein